MTPESKAKPKSKKETDEDERIRQHVRWMYGADIVHSVMKYFIIGVFVLAIVYTGVYLPVQASAGQQTTVTVFFQWIFDANVHVYLGWAVAGGCGLYARSERKKRLAERAERDQRIIELERMIDSKRETSGVSTEGEKREKSK